MANLEGKRADQLSASRKSVESTFIAGLGRVIATNADHEKIIDLYHRKLLRCQDARRPRVAVPKSAAPKCTASDLESAPSNVLCISRLMDLTDEVVTAIRHAGVTKHIVFVGGLPIEAMASRLMALRIRSPERLHLTAKSDVDAEAYLIRRMLAGMMRDEQAQAIADAWTEGDALVVLSASFERMRIERVKLGPFLGNAVKSWRVFEIDEDGRYLHWPDGDVHLGWRQLEQLLDPTKSIADQKRSESFKQQYGQAIRELRESAGLKQTDIDGLTDRQLRRIEHGEQMVSSKALELLASAHGLSIADYMNRLAACTRKQ